MPLIVTSDHLRAGMRLARSVLGCEGQLLLSAGIILTEQMIVKLLRRGVEACFVYLPGETEINESEWQSLVPEHMERQLRGHMSQIVQNVVHNRSLHAKELESLQKCVSQVISIIFEDSTAVLFGLKNISSHDQYTYEHMIGVMTVALLLSRRGEEEGIFVLSYQDKINIGLGALFHDIGKLMLPSSLINKKGSLNSEEWALMKKHPYDGFKIVREFPCINPMARAIVLNHHQYWNGEGYGRVGLPGLYGEKIPLLVRLVSVADSYDALVSDRPYRRAFLPAEALKIIRKEAGIKFDPAIVPLLEKVIIPYPVGSILFLSDWTLSAVTSIVDGEPQVMILGPFRQEDEHKLGCVFPLKNQAAQIIIGAPSLEHLALKTAEILTSPKDFGTSAYRFLESIQKAFHDRKISLASLPSWEHIIKNGFIPSLLEHIPTGGD